MNHYLVKVKITFGDIFQDQKLLIHANDHIHATVNAYRFLARGGLEPSDSGYFDMGGEIHLEVIRVDEVAPEHLAILEHYLEGKPLPQQPDGWHVSWEIDLDKGEADTPRQAAEQAVEYALHQFERLLGHPNGCSLPAFTINGQLIDFELDH